MERERGEYMNMWGSISSRGYSKSRVKKVLGMFKKQTEARVAEKGTEWVEFGFQSSNGPDHVRPPKGR